MSLTAQEFDVARKAYKQVNDCDVCLKNIRRWPFWAFFWSYYFFTVGRLMLSAWKHGYWESVITDITILTIVVLLMGFRYYRYRLLVSCYAANLRLLEDLRQKLGSELPSEIKEERPLLYFWSRRLEQRAILWRLDAFLSRKPISN